jgi:hypothetical protein
MSDNFEEDLTGVSILKSGAAVAVSSQEGNISLFKWDWFGDCNDRIPGHPSSIDALL